MRRLIGLFAFLILWASVAGAQSIITVEVYDSGYAQWTMEKRISLINQTEIDDWQEFIEKGDDPAKRQTEILDFSRRIEWFISSAEKFSNRSMNAEKFNISYDMIRTPSNAFGIIRYSFEWKNFSHTDSTRILVGDAFSEGQLLSSDNVLVIKIPDGYEVESASPGFDKRDGTRLIWDGTLYRSFDKGEPALVLSRTGVSSFTWFMIVVAMVGLISGTSMLILRRRKQDLTTATDIASPGGEIVLTPLPDQVKQDLEDEEMIELFLKRFGGEAYQSDIVRESRLSKSKISIVLAKMKEDGRILKIKKGKENLIRLAK